MGKCDFNVQIVFGVSVSLNTLAYNCLGQQIHFSILFSIPYPFLFSTPFTSQTNSLFLSVCLSACLRWHAFMLSCFSFHAILSHSTSKKVPVAQISLTHTYTHARSDWCEHSELSVSLSCCMWFRMISRKPESSTY